MCCAKQRTIQRYRHVTISVTLQRNLCKFACSPSGKVSSFIVFMPLAHLQTFCQASLHMCLIILKFRKLNKINAATRNVIRGIWWHFSETLRCGGEADHKDDWKFKSKFLEMLTGIGDSLSRSPLWPRRPNQLHWHLLSITTRVTNHLAFFLTGHE